MDQTINLLAHGPNNKIPTRGPGIQDLILMGLRPPVSLGEELRDFWKACCPLVCRTACTLVSPYGRVTPGNGINKLILLTCDMAPDSLLHTKINIFFNYYRLSTYQDSIIIFLVDISLSFCFLSLQVIFGNYNNFIFLYILY